MPTSRRRVGTTLALVLLIAGLVWWTRRGSEPDDNARRPARPPELETLFSVPPETTPLAWRAWSDSTFARARKRNTPLVALLDAAWSESSQLYVATLAASDTLRSVLETDVVAVRLDIDRRPDVHARFHVTFDTVPTVVLFTPAGRVWDVREPLTPAHLIEALADLKAARRHSEDSEIDLLETSNPAPADAATPVPAERVSEILGALAEAWPHPETVLEFDTPILTWDAFGFLRAHAEASNSPVSRALFLQGLRQLLASRLLRDAAVWRDVEAADGRVSRAAFLETNAVLLDHFVTASQWTNDDVYREAARGLRAFLTGTLWHDQHGLFRAAQGTLVLNESGWPLLTGDEHASMRGHEHAAALQPAIVPVFPSAANARACIALLHANAQVELAQRTLGLLWDAYEQRGRLPHDFDVDAQGRLRASAHDFAVDYAEVGMTFLAAATLASNPSDARLWNGRARALADRLLQDFAVPGTGLFRDARGPASVAPERMRVRLTPLVDNVRIARFLSLVTVHTGDPRYGAAARGALQAWNDDLWSRSVWEACEFALAMVRL